MELELRPLHLESSGENMKFSKNGEIENIHVGKHRGRDIGTNVKDHVKKHPLASLFIIFPERKRFI